MVEGAEGGLPDMMRDIWAAADERAATGMRDEDERPENEERSRFSSAGAMPMAARAGAAAVALPLT